MTNIICLLYVGWVTNYIATVSVKVQEPISEKKLEEDKGDTLRIIERLDHLESVIKQHIQGGMLDSGPRGGCAGGGGGGEWIVKRKGDSLGRRIGSFVRTGSP
ncbi:polypeptide N-acetylgalactosaminyltransferase 18 [Crotalus adamanteus]|uniref:Polypeptide N-acetylgalactosaminyltransferase 18 n=1 Tax=Crotalus adamanteus TaxID=8729 RepID=A0AAW1C790_CROAD